MRDNKKILLITSEAVNSDFSTILTQYLNGMNYNTVEDETGEDAYLPLTSEGDMNDTYRPVSPECILEKISSQIEKHPTKIVFTFPEYCLNTNSEAQKKAHLILGRISKILSYDTRIAKASVLACIHKITRRDERQLGNALRSTVRLIGLGLPDELLYFPTHRIHYLEPDYNGACRNKVSTTLTHCSPLTSTVKLLSPVKLPQQPSAKQTRAVFSGKTNLLPQRFAVSNTNKLIIASVALASLFMYSTDTNNPEDIKSTGMVAFGLAVFLTTVFAIKKFLSKCQNASNAAASDFKSGLSIISASLVKEAGSFKQQTFNEYKDFMQAVTGLVNQLRIDIDKVADSTANTIDTAGTTIAGVSDSTERLTTGTLTLINGLDRSQSKLLSDLRPLTRSLNRSLRTVNNELMSISETSRFNMNRLTNTTTQNMDRLTGTTAHNMNRLTGAIAHNMGRLTGTTAQNMDRLTNTTTQNMDRLTDTTTQSMARLTEITDATMQSIAHDLTEFQRAGSKFLNDDVKDTMDKLVKAIKNGALKPDVRVDVSGNKITVKGVSLW